MDVIKEVNLHLSSKFDMEVLDETNLTLGMAIMRDQVIRKLQINQRKYIEIVLKFFNMQD
jgi:hypothetical protein